MARREQDLDVESGELQALPAGEGVIGLVALERAEPGRHPAHHVGEHRTLDLRAVHRRTGGAGDRRDRPDVVEVAVREQDRLELDPERLHRLQQPLGLVPRVDHHGRRASRRRDARCRSSPGPGPTVKERTSGAFTTLLLGGPRRGGFAPATALIHPFVGVVADRDVHHEHDREEGEGLCASGAAAGSRSPPSGWPRPSRARTRRSRSAAGRGGPAAPGGTWPRARRPSSRPPSAYGRCARATRPRRRRCRDAWC